VNPWHLFQRLFGSGGSAFSDTLNGSIDRANLRFLLPGDSALYLTSRTRTGINEHVEWLWQNFGIVKEGVAGIARHTVGKGITLELDSEDDNFNRAGEEDFGLYAATPDRCDLAGRRTFAEATTTGVEQRIIRGEFFSAKTQNPEWGNEPCFQLYDSQEIATPPIFDPGLSILDGAQLDPNSRVLNWFVRQLDGITYTPVPRERMCHWFKPHAVNQIRGISDLAQSVNRLVDIHELTRLATRSAKAQQLLALVLKGVAKKKTKGAFGAIANAGTKADGTPDTDTAQLEKMVGAAGAGIAYLDAEGSAELITPNTPSPLIEGFITDLLMRDVCAGWGVPAEFFWSIAKLGGANTRFVLSKADLLFQILADGIIGRFCTPTAFRYLDHRIASGKLPRPKDPFWALRINWQTPPRVTVDNGKDAATLIELLANGMITLREYCHARGDNYRQVMRQWIREPIEFLHIAKQELKSSELDAEQQKTVLDRWSLNLPLWRAAKPGAAANSNPNEKPAKPDPNETDEDGEDPAKAA
jgi:capsid protein